MANQVAVQRISRSRSQRVYRRVAVEFKVRFEKVAQAAEAVRAYAATTQNISVGGMCLRSVGRWPTGTLLILSMKVEGTDFRLRGEVVWQRGSLFGLKFACVSQKERKLLG